MSRTCFKTTYNETGPYYSTLEKTMYVEHCNSSDTVTFYDEKGRVLLCVEDTVDNNMLDAINRLYAPFKNNDGDEVKEGVEKIFKQDIPDWDVANPRPVIRLEEAILSEFLEMPDEVIGPWAKANIRHIQNDCCIISVKIERDSEKKVQSDNIHLICTIAFGENHGVESEYTFTYNIPKNNKR